MPYRKKKIFFYLLIAVVLFAVSTNVLFGGKDITFMETSVMSLLKNYAPKPADLVLEKAVLTKKVDPHENFNYYKYKATLVLKNNGGDLKNARVLVKSKNGAGRVIENSEDGFSLKSGETYIARDQEFIFDGGYNGGTAKFEIDLTDKFDFDLENNVYEAEVFDNNAKIENIHLIGVTPDGDFEIDYDATKFRLREHKFELFYGNNFVVGDDREYAEFNDTSYEVFKNSSENLGLGVLSESVRSIKFENVPLYFYVKATDPVSGNFAISDVVKIDNEESLTRAEFAKEFIDSAGIPLSYEGFSNLDDVGEDQWYRPYIQTLYNLGFIKMETEKFGPDEIMTRRGAMYVVMDYFDVDLFIPSGAPHFSDVAFTDPIYAYVESYYGSDTAGYGKYFVPEGPLTKKFLKHLIDEYSKSN